jgi:hypothetical protein
MKFSADCHFIYIIVHVDGHKQQLQSYYKLTKEDLEEITKEWSADFLNPSNPADLSDVDSPEAGLDTPGPSKMKKPVEVQDIDSTYVRIVSISPDEGGDGEEIEGAEIEQ